MLLDLWLTAISHFNIEKMKKRVKKAIYNQVKKTVMGTGKKDNGNKNLRKRHADTVIRNHVIWSMGAGFIPILVADVFAVSALQLDMIRQLCKVYDIDFEETRGKALVTSLTSATLARLGARSLVKLIPGLGTYIGGMTVSAFAGASTYALGEVFKLHFESGGTILDFDPDRVRRFYRDKFEKGKDVVKDWSKDDLGDIDVEIENDEIVADKKGGFKKMDPIVEDDILETPPFSEPVVEKPKDPLTQLKELGDLRDKGVITEAEFKTLKKKLIDDF